MDPGVKSMRPLGLMDIQQMQQIPYSYCKHTSFPVMVLHLRGQSSRTSRINIKNWSKKGIMSVTFPHPYKIFLVEQEKGFWSLAICFPSHQLSNASCMDFLAFFFIFPVNNYVIQLRKSWSVKVEQIWKINSPQNVIFSFTCEFSCKSYL